MTQGWFAAIGVTGTMVLLVAGPPGDVGGLADDRTRSEIATYVVTGDAIEQQLVDHEPDAARGRLLVLDRFYSQCLNCHTVPGEPAEQFQGNIGPPLDDVGNRLTEGQIRLRLVDSSLVNPNTIMPPYHRTHGLNRVAPEFRGKAVFSAREVEDVVAYLKTLKGSGR